MLEKKRGSRIRAFMSDIYLGISFVINLGLLIAL